MKKIDELRRQINVWLPEDLVKRLDRAVLALGVATGRRVHRRDAVEKAVRSWLKIPANPL